jgi:hypothetical protein
VDKEHIKGAADKAKGAVKDALGKMTGDKKMQSRRQVRQGQGCGARSPRRRQRRRSQIMISTPHGRPPSAGCVESQRLRISGASFLFAPEAGLW